MTELERVVIASVVGLLTGIHESASCTKARYVSSNALRALFESLGSVEMAAGTDDDPTGT